MKKTKTHDLSIISLFLLMAILLFCVSVGISQPIIQGNNPNKLIGQHFNVELFTDTLFDVGPSGANQVWDFSTIVSDSTLTKTIVVPDSTAYAVYFEESNICYKNSDGRLYYYTIDSNKYEYHGTYNGNLVIWGDLENHQELMSFPFTYQTNFVDTFTNQFNYFGINYFRKGVSTSVADGYGDIILPYDTIRNVLRVKRTDIFTDSASFFFNPVQGKIETTIWYKPGIVHNVFVYIKSSYNGVDSYYGSYLNDIKTSLKELTRGKAQDLRMYPNPVKNSLSLKLNDVPYDETLHIRITNIQGNTVLEVDQNYNQLIELDVANFAPGTYIVSVIGERYYWNQVLIKSE